MANLFCSRFFYLFILILINLFTVVTPAQPRKQINYKQLYFKRKSQNALLERRKFYQDKRLRQKEHTFLLKEHQLRMQIMKEELEKK